MAKRKSIKPNPEKEEKTFEGQHLSAKLINRIASDLNTIISLDIGSFKKSDFYHRVQSLLRKNPSESMILLLNRLRGMEVNPEYPSFSYRHNLSTTTTKRKIIVSLQPLNHISPRKCICNCYNFKVLLITYDKSKKPAQYFSQYSDWVNMKGGRPAFEFDFTKPPRTTHWLICIRQIFGMNYKAIGTYASETMYIGNAGTFDTEEQALLDKDKEPKETSVELFPRRIPENEIVRVKPKRIDDN